MNNKQTAAVRLEKLRTLANQHGGVHLAKLLGFKNSSYISHVLNGRRPITERFCENVETKLGLPSGWMSREGGDGAGAALGIQRAALAAILTAVRGAAPSLTPEAEARIVTLVYMRFVESGKIDTAYVQDLVQLAEG
jgi:hypothetical protein